MKNHVFLFLIILLLPGCIRTYRYEHSRIIDTGISTAGNSYFNDNGEEAEREWLGFWPFQPRHIRP